MQVDKGGGQGRCRGSERWKQKKDSESNKDWTRRRGKDRERDRVRGGDGGEEREGGAIQVESVQLTCQMAALAALSMQRWRSCNMARRLQIVTPLLIQTVQ